MSTTKLLGLLGMSMTRGFLRMFKALTKMDFQTNADYIGTFVLVYLSMGGGFVFSMILLGINPTLVLSVVAAPVWIYIVFTSNRITKFIIKKKKEGKL
tara:strand:- start:205 stop:498 length:294 start_codon:yes stop_codon:yes gene_type:complete